MFLSVVEQDVTNLTRPDTPSLSANTFSSSRYSTFSFRRLSKPPERKGINIIHLHCIHIPKQKHFGSIEYNSVIPDSYDNLHQVTQFNEYGNSKKHDLSSCHYRNVYLWRKFVQNKICKCETA